MNDIYLYIHYIPNCAETCLANRHILALAVTAPVTQFRFLGFLDCLAISIVAMAVARSKEYLLKGVDPFDEKSSIQSLLGTDLKGRVLQEAIWNVYQARRYVFPCVLTCACV